MSTPKPDLGEWLALAREAVRNGDAPKAISLYRQIGFAFSDNKRAAVEAGASLAALGRPYHALQIVMNGRAHFPTSRALLNAEADVRYAAKDLAGSAQVLRQLAEQRPDDVGALRRWGIMAALAGLQDDARYAFNRSLELNPDYEGLLQYGAAHEHMGDLLNAEILYRRAIETQPAQLEAWLSLVRLMAETRRLAKAEGNLNRLTMEFPESAKVFSILAAVQLRQRRLIEALAAVNTALALDEKHVHGHFIRGAILLELGDPAEAFASFERALSLAPPDKETLLGFANAAAALGKYEQGAEALRRLLAIDRAHPHASHFYAAWTGGLPAERPVAHVRTLFDGLAATFDDVTTATQYAAPEHAVTLLRLLATQRDAFASLCDIGCGTGAVAEALSGSFDIPVRLGIDVSQNMLALAQQHGHYTHLVNNDIEPALQSWNGNFSLMTALDAFPYVGDLAVLSTLARRLVPDGILAFSTESADATDGYRLDVSGRFVHSTGYVAQAIDRAGLKRRRTQDVILREGGPTRVEGQIWIVQKEGP